MRFRVAIPAALLVLILLILLTVCCGSNMAEAAMRGWLRRLKGFAAPLALRRKVKTFPHALKRYRHIRFPQEFPADCSMRRKIAFMPPKSHLL